MVSVARWSELEDRVPAYALVGETDLVVIRLGEEVRVLYGRCLGMRACHTNNCPVGIATQKPHLRQRLEIAVSARRLTNYLEATVHLMAVLARACGHDRLSALCADDLTTWKRDVAWLTGVAYAGVVPL